MKRAIPFNWPYMTGREFDYIREAHRNGILAGDGPLTKRCERWFEEHTGSRRVLLTHSCTAALELAALLLDTAPGDEIIMPSFTFVSTANAFALRGGVPVFVDIRPDTLNLDERLIEAAITARTRAIVPVHYAGVACAMDPVMEIATHYKLTVIEDAAQGVLASYRGRALGSIGQMGAYSFHETKNLTAGEGGALLVENPELASRAEVVREKGTDRSSYFRGEVGKYSWQELGSSYLPGEIVAGFLLAQLESADEITEHRQRLWRRYHELLAPLEAQELLRRPVVPPDCTHNAHIYYVVLAPGTSRAGVLDVLGHHQIDAISHYVPLHSSPAGRRFGRPSGSLQLTEEIAEHVVRLPLWIGLEPSDQDRVVEVLHAAIAKHGAGRAAAARPSRRRPLPMAA